jgi:hypothetical protein
MIDKKKIFITVVDEYMVRKKISLNDAEKLFGINWIELDEKNLGILEFVEIHYMGKTLGWGLFSKKQIPANTILGIFSGEIRYQSRTAPIASEHVFLKDYKNNQFQVVDASRSGNITRFLQHLPSKNIIMNLKVEDAIKMQIAAENVKKELHEITSDIYTERYITTEVIEAGTIIGCCYDQQFWYGKSPCYLSKTGAVLHIEDTSYNKDGHQRPMRNYIPENRYPRLFFFQHANTNYKILFAMLIASMILYRYGILDNFCKLFFDGIGSVTKPAGSSSMKKSL